MSPIKNDMLKKANIEAIYNLYLYLVHKSRPEVHQTFGAAVRLLEESFSLAPDNWSQRETLRLSILKNAVLQTPTLSSSVINELTVSKSGLTACSFIRPDGSISVVFRGTGSGEWIDNGEGLSGMPEKNNYITYGKCGKAVHFQIVQEDYATDQQVQALNWFNFIAVKHGWSELTDITVSGHSKGGNKAQFVTIHSALIDNCFSFDGQGFSPEALSHFRARLGEKYYSRRLNMISLSAANDYVNVLGERLIPEENIYFFESENGLHQPEAILNQSGELLPQKEQGELSLLVERVSSKLMDMPPFVRQYATLGVMNVFQKYLGSGTPVNGDSVSLKKTIAGLGIALGSLLRSI